MTVECGIPVMPFNLHWWYYDIEFAMRWCVANGTRRPPNFLKRGVESTLNARKLAIKHFHGNSKNSCLRFGNGRPGNCTLIAVEIDVEARAGCRIGWVLIRNVADECHMSQLDFGWTIFCRWTLARVLHQVILSDRDCDRIQRCHVWPIIISPACDHPGRSLSTKSPVPNHESRANLSVLNSWRTRLLALNPGQIDVPHPNEEISRGDTQDDGRQPSDQ